MKKTIPTSFGGYALFHNFKTFEEIAMQVRFLLRNHLGLYAEKNPSSRSRAYYTIVPVRGWSPIEGINYEVEVEKEIPSRKRNCLGVKVVGPIDAERDEVSAAEAQEAEKAKKNLAEKIERETAAMKKTGEDLETVLFSKFGRDEGLIGVLGFAELLKEARLTASNGRSYINKDTLQSAADITDEEISAVGQWLEASREAFRPVKNKFLQKVKVAEEKLDTVQGKRETDYPKKVIFKDKEYLVDDAFYFHTEKFGTWDVHHGESNDSFRPAFTSQKSGMRTVREKITDPSLLNIVKEIFTVTEDDERDATEQLRAATVDYAAEVGAFWEDKIMLLPETYRESARVTLAAKLVDLRSRGILWCFIGI